MTPTRPGDTLDPATGDPRPARGERRSGRKKARPLTPERVSAEETPHARPTGGEAISNDLVAEVLHEMALRLEAEDIPFKPRAYENAAAAVGSLERPLQDIYGEGGTKALEEIPAIGHRIAMRIGEILETGKLGELEASRQKLPVDMVKLSEVEGIGPKTIRALHEAIGVCTIEDLERAVREGKVRTLPHFGETSEHKLASALEFYRAAHARRPIGDVLDVVRGIERRLRKVTGVEQLEVAGSFRRRKETIGDIDIVLSSLHPADAVAAFTALPEVRHVYAQGNTKTLVRLEGDLDADLRIVNPASFGAALQYFTGNKDHNVALRSIAKKKGLKLSEYGLFRGDEVVAGRTENEIYAALGLDFVPPELRENTGEIEAALHHRLPALIGFEALEGDLQVHTQWTDGTGSVRDMAEAAQRLGRKYIAITDHARDLPMVHGLDETRLREQVAEVRGADRALCSRLRVLAGIEANIRADGSLDVNDDMLAELDFVGAAIHSHFDQPKHEMTARLIRAIESPFVDVLFHPLGRIFGRRPAVDVDVDALIEAARRTGTVLEIDAQPDRLDLRDDLVRRAIAAGVRLLIDSDAHRPNQLGLPEAFGIAVARRGWAQSSDVLNTRPLASLLGALKPRPRPISNSIR